MAIGADVGGSRLKIVRLVLDEVVSRRQVEIKRDWPLQLAEELAGLVAGDEPVGVGVGGLVDHKTGIMHWAPHLSGVAIPVGDNLSERLGRRVEVDNDANCATRAEAAGLAEDPILVAMLGTGIGAGLWSGGGVYRGKAFAGEVGHMTIEPDGRICRCGRRGCWETRVSGWQLATDGTTSDALGEAGIWFGRGLLNLATILDPQLIVIGGGVIDQHGEAILGAARAEMATRSDAHRPPPTVVSGRFGIWAGAIGAAMLAR